MRTTTNPVFRNLPEQVKAEYATFDTTAAPRSAEQPTPFVTPGASAPASTRPMTIDDVVQKTAITLAVIVVGAVVNYAIINNNPGLGSLLGLGGALVGFGLAMFAVFTRRMDRPGLVLGYAAAEGLFLGSLSYLFTFQIEGVSAGLLIGQAVIATFGVFFGMLVVYKVGAIRVTPRLTRMVTAGLFGVLALMIANLVASFFTDGGFGLRDGGPVAIIFSLICIGLAAFSFLIDFDSADEAIRAQVPAQMAWGIAFGLAVTLVWLYTEILRLLSMLNSNN